MHRRRKLRVSRARPTTSGWPAECENPFACATPHAPTSGPRLKGSNRASFVGARFRSSSIITRVRRVAFYSLSLSLARHLHPFSKKSHAGASENAYGSILNNVAYSCCWGKKWWNLLCRLRSLLLSVSSVLLAKCVFAQKNRVFSETRHLLL
jgi:hypothetical protein